MEIFNLKEYFSKDNIKNESTTLESFLKPFLKKQLSKDDIYNIANKIVSFYTDINYVNKNIIIIDSIVQTRSKKEKIESNIKNIIEIDTLRSLLQLKTFENILKTGILQKVFQTDDAYQILDGFKRLQKQLISHYNLSFDKELTLELDSKINFLNDKSLSLTNDLNFYQKQLQDLEKYSNKLIHEKNNIEEKYDIFCSKLKELSKLKEISDSISEIESKYKLYSSYKSGDVKRIKQIENLVYLKIEELDKKSYSIKNSNVISYSKKIPSPSLYNLNNDYINTSKEFKLNTLEKILIKSSSSIFNIKDYNYIMFLFKDDIIKHKEQMVDFSIINNLYNIDESIKTKFLIDFDEKLKIILDLEDKIEFILDETNSIKHKIEHIMNLNEWYADLNKHLLKNFDLVDINIKKIKIKIASDLNNYEKFINHINEKELKSFESKILQRISSKTNDNFKIIELDRNNYKKEIVNEEISNLNIGNKSYSKNGSIVNNDFERNFEIYS